MDPNTASTEPQDLDSQRRQDEEQLNELVSSLQATLVPMWNQTHTVLKTSQTLSPDVVGQLKRLEQHMGSLLVGVLEMTAIRMIEGDNQDAEMPVTGQPASAT